MTETIYFLKENVPREARSQSHSFFSPQTNNNMCAVGHTHNYFSFANLSLSRVDKTISADRYYKQLFARFDILKKWMNDLRRKKH